MYPISYDGLTFVSFILQSFELFWTYPSYCKVLPMFLIFPVFSICHGNQDMGAIVGTTRTGEETGV